MRDPMRRSVDPRFGVNGARSDNFRAEPAKSFHFAVTWASLTAQLELRDVTVRKLSVAFETDAAQPEPVEIHAAELHALDPEVVEHDSTSLAVLAAAVASPPVALTPIHLPETRPESEGRWEMVVPKMDRPSRARPASASAAPNHRHNGNGHVTDSVPAFASASAAPSPLFSRALALLGHHTRALIAGPPADGTTFDSEKLHQTNGHAGRAPVLHLNARDSAITGENSSPQNDGATDGTAVRALWLSKITNALRGRLHTPGVTGHAAAADEGFSELDHQQEPWLPGAESKKHEESTPV